jgi:hypothetical protein
MVITPIRSLLSSFSAIARLLSCHRHSTPTCGAGNLAGDGIWLLKAASAGLINE